MNKSSRRQRLVILGAAVFGIFLISGSAAVAILQPAGEDFSPFTMQITEWKAAMASTPEGVIIAGTRVTRLEWTNSRNWKTTLLRHSADSRYEGSTHQVTDQGSSSFDGLTRHAFGWLFGNEQGREVPSRWLIPGLVDVLSSRGFSRTENVANGTVTLRQSSRQLIMDPNSNSKEVTSETIAVYDLKSRLPLSVKLLHDGQLKESTEFAVLSRP